MAFVNSSEVVLAYVSEGASPGTTPASPAFERIRITGESVSQNTLTAQSNEIRPNRNVSDLIITGKTVQGGLDFELSYGTFDDLIAAALGGTWTANVVKGGTGEDFFTIEKFLDAGAVDQYIRFTGCAIGGMTVNIRAREPITGNFTVQGRASTRGTAILAGATYTGPTEPPVLRASGAAAITIGGSASTAFFTDLSFQVQNNLVELPQVGSDELAGVIFGQRVVTGSLSAYFDAAGGAAIFDAANDPSTTSTLAFDLREGGATSNRYTISFPRIRIFNPVVAAQGNNQAVAVQAQFQALDEPTTAATDVMITRTAAA